MTTAVLMIDNLDSFVFNLAESFRRLGAAVQVFRNTISSQQVMELAGVKRALIVLSPGPGRPEEAGCSVPLVRAAIGKVPLLGVCLGHQAMAHEAGAEVVAADSIVHGKASLVDHDGQGLMAGLSSPLAVGRYHSLCVRQWPARMHIHAQLGGMSMAVSDVAAKQLGVQFHPESILTPAGDRILQNALTLAHQWSPS